MWMVFVVVLEPSGDLPECGDRIRKRGDASIVSLERFDDVVLPHVILLPTASLRMLAAAGPLLDLGRSATLAR
jgi:hypothetical protein